MFSIRPYYGISLSSSQYISAREHGKFDGFLHGWKMHVKLENFYLCKIPGNSRGNLEIAQFPRTGGPA